MSSQLEKIDSFKKKTGITLPDGFKILDWKSRNDKNIVVKRPDGFIVFLNEDDHSTINYIRLHADKKDVMMAVGLYRGMQIADNYKQRYAHLESQEDVDYVGFIDNILQVVGKVKFISRGE